MRFQKTIKTQANKQYKALNQSYVERLKWYQTPQWKKLRYEFLKINPYCIRCGAKSTVADHRDGHNPLTWKETFFTSQLDAYCTPCHSRKTVLEDMKNKPKRMTQQEKLKLLTL